MADLAVLLADAPYHDVLRRVGEVAAREKVEVYAVGGLVRDLLLARATTDLDFVTVGAASGEGLAGAVARALGGKTVHVYPAFGTAAIRLPRKHGGHVLEFVGARRESYRSHSRKPDVEAGTLADDLARRDFTVNALALDLAPGAFGTLIDHFGGLADLDAGVLRTPLDPAQTFRDDPLRMVRAARFAAQLGFGVHPAALAAMREEAARVEIVSAERVEAELQKLIATPRPSGGWRVLFEGGVLAHLLPELADLAGVEAIDGVGHKDNFYHTLQVLDNVAAATARRDPDETRYLRWAALLHDIGKARTKRWVPGTGWTFHAHDDVGSRMVEGVFRRLKLPLDARLDYVRSLVRLHHRPHALVDDEVTDSAVRRLLFDAGDKVEDLMTLVRADLTSKNPRRVRRYLRGFDAVEAKMALVEEKDRLRAFQPPVDGNEIMAALGVREGLAVGILKERIKEAILEGDIPNEHDAAFAFMMRHRDDALRRGRLFDELVRLLPREERPAMGALRQALALDALPEGDDEARAYLAGVKARALAAPAGQDA